jgi:hypothetical protein
MHDPLSKSQGVVTTRSAASPRKFTVTDSKLRNHTKDPRFVHEPSRNTFKIYFDELPTGKQADRMLSYLKDGKFIDSRTNNIHVDIVSYNAQEDLFCIGKFTFEWQTSGTVIWDYKLNRWAEGVCVNACYTYAWPCLLLSFALAHSYIQSHVQAYTCT